MPSDDKDIAETRRWTWVSTVTAGVRVSTGRGLLPHWMMRYRIDNRISAGTAGRLWRGEAGVNTVLDLTHPSRSHPITHPS